MLKRIPINCSWNRLHTVEWTLALLVSTWKVQWTDQGNHDSPVAECAIGHSAAETLYSRNSGPVPTAQKREEIQRRIFWAARRNTS